MPEEESNPKRPDIGFYAIVALVGVIAGWLLLMPWIPGIASATIHRFHLRTSSFTWWAIQAPIPSMYNLANQYEVGELQPELPDDPLFQPMFEFPISEQPATDHKTEKRYINHYPVRVITFANRRYRYFNDGNDRWVTVTSRYRGQHLESKYQVRRRDSDSKFFEYDLILLDDVDDSE